MNYPEGTRLLVLLKTDDVPVLAMQSDDILFELRGGHIGPNDYDWIVRESAAKCAERMLDMLKAFRENHAVDFNAVTALIAEAEGNP